MGRYLEIAQFLPMPESASKENGNNLREKREKGSVEMLNADLSRCHERIIQLRIGNPRPGTRAEGLAWLHRKTEELAARSVSFGGTEDGWPDPEDVFADGDQLTVLREALAEVKAGLYPLPLPDGCVLSPQANFDPFQADPPRYYNGKVIGATHGD